MALTVEEWPIDRLVEYGRNPRKNDAQVDRMCGAIREFGFRIPIVAKSDGLVVDGHLRLKAARKIGMKSVPVALADELSENQIKAFRLLANQSANWAEWDIDLLKFELSELQADDYNLDLTGFSDAELADLLAPDAEDEAPAKTTGGAGSLAARFGIPPFTVLNAREGWWQDRKRAWLAIGIQSELGRGEQLIPNGGVTEAGNGMNQGGARVRDQLQESGQAKRVSNAPGGSARPATDYSKSRARGDGTGRAMNG
jgi:hypothetical protein